VALGTGKEIIGGENWEGELIPDPSHPKNTLDFMELRVEV
jgi:hypothetical protein